MFSSIYWQVTAYKLLYVLNSQHISFYAV